MSHSPAAYIASFLSWWSRKVLKFPMLLVLASAALAGYSLHFTVNNLGVNTNTGQMLAPDLPFQQNRARLEQAFPQDASVFLVVVEAATPEETSQAAIDILHRLKAQTDHFDSVYIPTDNDFFRRQALLYLDIDALENLSQRLTDAQPFLGYLSQNFRLEGLFSLLSQALTQEGQASPVAIQPLLEAIDTQADDILQGRPGKLSWQDLLSASDTLAEPHRVVVIAKPKLKYDEILPAEHALKAARAVIDDITRQNARVSVRITGEPALEHEELETVTESATIAGIVSLVLVVTSLISALRSIKLLLATFLSLILGLMLTAGFAAVSIGHLNLISIAFAVLYIGLGVDYAIHFCLHYRSHRVAGLENEQAIHQTIETIGVPIFLCALTTSIGFFAFIPTDYSGVSELGIISGVGMFIGLFISLTVLPALLKLLAIKNLKPLPPSPLPAFVAYLPFKQALPIRVISIILGLISAALLTYVTFDSNPINMRNPDSESVSTIKELLTSPTDSPFTLATLAPDLATAQTKARQFKQLPTVHEAIVLSDLVAEEQEDKLAMIQDLTLIMGHQLSNLPGSIETQDPLHAVTQFIVDLKKVAAKLDASSEKAAVIDRLIAHLTALADGAQGPQRAQTLEHSLLTLLPYTLDRLKQSLSAQAFDITSLPDEIVSNWVSSEGLYKILITPVQDLNKPQNLKQFVIEAQSVDPAVTGLPVADQASGEAVVLAFKEAFASAVVAIFVLLLLMLKNWRHATLIIATLLLAAMLTGAANVILDNAFNFANIIALPLLMGMGVDSSIHILHQLQSGGSDRQDVLRSSTARGVFFSSVTTLCSFSSLAFAAHLGTASMGLLLAVGIGLTLVCTLFVLPAFYITRSGL